MKPQESDALLSRIWRDFSHTEAHSALLLTIDSLTREAELPLLHPATLARTRAYAAGQVAGLRRLLTSMSAAITFDPATADYSNQGPEPDDLPGMSDDDITY